MPVQLSVGLPVLTINHGSTFMVTDLNGEIAAHSEQGVFAEDTRFVSFYALTANGQPWTRLTSAATNYYSALVYLSNPELATEEGIVPAGTVVLTLARGAGEGIHEDLELANHGLTPLRFNLEITLRSDFADLFEVKDHRFVRRGRIVSEWDPDLQQLRTSYRNGEFTRELTYTIDHSGAPPAYANGQLTFDIQLAPGGRWHTCADYVLATGSDHPTPIRPCFNLPQTTEHDVLQQAWLARATTLTSTNEDVGRLYRESVEDMGALRLHDHDFAADVWLPAAGVPWFVTIFGRDSLLVSLQNASVYPRFALGTLQKLAELQATEADDWRDAQPGKMPHEIRYGELAYLKRVPHTPYYGTADATPLYLITLHEAWKWLGDASLLRRYREVALRCLQWIEEYGDLDGDGFQEYQTRSARGYQNMGWKDAGDAVVYPDGTQVQQPKALCELQGYVFDAWLRMAEVFEVLDEPDRAARLRQQAAGLQQRFEEQFWCEDMGFYAFGLDPNKVPIRTVASNPGHLLWSGLVRPDRAARVVERLRQTDMWSGWGIRTLSAQNPAYNPTSYQCGSVWPHDNGLIALGFKRYGFAAEAAEVARDVIEAATYFTSYRLPELYAGIERRPGTYPVQYLGANVPQAWAAGSVFHLIQALLGLRADAPQGILYVDPELPPWLPDVQLRGLSVGGAKVDLQVWREGERSVWDATIREGTLEVEQQAWEPWAVDGTRR